jgi:hypothetical protein
VKRPGDFSPDRFCPQEAADEPQLLALILLSPVPAPAEEVAAEAAEAVAGTRPSPGSPSHPGTSASPEAAEVVAEAAAVVAEAAVGPRNYTSALPKPNPT